MEEVNALKIRNNLGEILDRLNATGEPIYVSKGRKIRAVLVTKEQFERRFLDVLAEEKKTQFLEKLKNMRQKRKEATDSLTVIRSIRGYTK